MSDSLTKAVSEANGVDAQKKQPRKKMAYPTLAIHDPGLAAEEPFVLAGPERVLVPLPAGEARFLSEWAMSASLETPASNICRPPVVRKVVAAHPPRFTFAG
jgi:hypothetical protein